MNKKIMRGMCMRPTIIGGLIGLLSVAIVSLLAGCPEAIPTITIASGIPVLDESVAGDGIDSDEYIAGYSISVPVDMLMADDVVTLVTGPADSPQTITTDPESATVMADSEPLEFMIAPYSSELMADSEVSALVVRGDETLSRSEALSLTISRGAESLQALSIIEDGDTTAVIGADDTFINSAENAGGYRVRVSATDSTSGFTADRTIEIFDLESSTPTTVIAMATTTAGTDPTDIVIAADMLPDGAYRLVAQIKDGTTIVGVSAGALGFMVDTTAPTMPETPTADDASTTTDEFINIADNEDGYTISVPATGLEAGTTVGLYSGTDQLGMDMIVPMPAAAVDFLFEEDTRLADAAYTVLARATDAAGNSADSAGTLNFAVDTVAPTFDVAPMVTPISGGLNLVYTAAGDTEVSFALLLDPTTSAPTDYAGIMAATEEGTDGKLIDADGTAASQTASVTGLMAANSYIFYVAIRDTAANELFITTTAAMPAP